MSEWLELMLDEIERKKLAYREAKDEAARRADLTASAENSGDENAATDDQRAPSPRR